ncbi:MAG: protein-disulfide reductase DsbD [Lysobacteraceae bacterium]
MSHLRLLLFACLALLGLSPAAAIDEADLLPIDEAFALSATRQDDGRIALRWVIAEGYYLYRHRIAVDSPDGSFAPGALALPDGIAYHDEFFGDVETYRGELLAVLDGTAQGGATQAQLRVRYQGCADLGVCYPPHAKTINVALSAAPSSAPFSALPLGNAGKPLLGDPQAVDFQVETLPLPAEQAFRFEAIATSPNVILMRFTPAPGYYLYRDHSEFTLHADGKATALAPQWPPAVDHHDEHFGQVAVYFDLVETPLPLQRHDAAAVSATLEAVFQGCQNNGICYPPITRRIDIDLPAASADSLVAATLDEGGDARFGLAVALLTLLSALLGGLILNLMPCVLPVLSLKALSLAQGGGAQARRSAAWYTLGVLVSFAAVGALVLALRQAGMLLGWGFQLQQPLAIAFLAFVMFIVGLALSGVFQIGAGLAGAGQSLTEKKGPAGDFFTGVLAVVVASPCTAPFMGPALAYAFGAPAWLALAVFLALGLGLALPFLLIGFIPALAQRLPRPGAWMDTFKQFMAFPMYLTAAWLVSVLAAQRGASAVLYVLAGFTLLALGLWWHERQRLRGSAWSRRAGMALAVVAVALTLNTLHGLPATTTASASAANEAEGEVAYSAERLAALRGEGRLVFVNMTADWCVTCKLNERAVLSQDTFRQALADAGGVYMKGDWTNVDPAITTFLESHKAVGVPLYVVYPAGGGEGEKLPTLLTAGIVTDALQRAHGR